MLKKIVVVLIIGLLLLPSAAFAQIGGTTTATYSLPDGTVEFDYPSTWELDEQDGTFATVTAPNGYWANVSSIVNDTAVTDPVASATNYASVFSDTLKEQFPAATGGEVIDFELDGNIYAAITIIDGTTQLDYVINYLGDDVFATLTSLGDTNLYPEVEEDLISIILSFRAGTTATASGSGSSGGLGGAAASGDSADGSGSGLGLGGAAASESDSGSTGLGGSAAGATSDNPFNNAGFGAGSEDVELIQVVRRPDNFLRYGLPEEWGIEERETYTLISAEGYTTTFGISGAPLSEELQSIEDFPIVRGLVYVEDMTEQYPDREITEVIEFEVNDQLATRVDTIEPDGSRQATLIVVTIDPAQHLYAFFTIVGDPDEITELEPVIFAILSSIETIK